MTDSPTPGGRVPDDRDLPGADATGGGSDTSGGTGDATGVGTLPEEQLLPVDEGAIASSMWAIVLAAGIGSRFWPLSSPERPKQLLPLIDDKPLIADTVQRLHPLIPPERVLVVTAMDIAPAIRRAIPEVPGANILEEPYPLGTAASVAWGAQEIARRAGPKTVFVSLHADLSAVFPEEFRHTLRRAAQLVAREGCLVAVGVPPTRPETGFGYIVPGTPVEDGARIAQGGACEARDFVEKPDVPLAETLIADGALWNSGIYVWEASTVLEQLQTHCPEVAPGLSALVRQDLPHFAERIDSVSIERGLLERTDDLVVVPADFGWDDVGTWESLRRCRDLDDDGNGAVGSVHFVDATSNVVHAEHGAVVLYGVERLLVVSLNGVTLVTTLEKARDMKPLLDALPPELRVRPARPPADA
jgi:mannose-1-phosphate guanylyltransferase